MRGVIVFSLLLVLSGCASSSGVYQVGPGLYRVATTAITSFGGEGTAKGEAYHAATQECQRQGKQLSVVDDTSDAQFTQASANLTFRCVAP